MLNTREAAISPTILNNGPECMSLPVRFANTAVRAIFFLSLFLMILQGTGFLFYGPTREAWLWSQAIQFLANVLAIAWTGIAFRRANGFAKVFWLLFSLALVLWGVANGFFLYRTYAGDSGWLASAFDFLYRGYGVPLLLLLLIPDDHQFWRDDWLPVLDTLQVGIAMGALYAGLFCFLVQRGPRGAATYFAGPTFSTIENALLIGIAILRLAFTKSDLVRNLLTRLLVFLMIYGLVNAAGDYLDAHSSYALQAWFDLFWTMPYAVAALVAVTWHPEHEKEIVLQEVAPALSRILNRNLAWAALVVCVPVVSAHFTGRRYFLGTLVVCASILLYALRLSLTQYRQSNTLGALLDRERKYRQFFEQNLAGNYISAPDGTILACNPAFTHIFGFTSEAEAKETNVVSLYPSPESRQDFLQKLKKDGHLQSFDKDLRRKDGSCLCIAENAIGNFDESGSLIEIHGFVIDETERRKAEKQLRQAQKMEAVGTLAGGIAHDLNNVLAVVIGYSEILLGEPNVDPIARHRVEQVLQAGNRAAALIRQLLAFGSKQVLLPRLISLNPVIEKMKDMLHRLLGDEIEIVTTLQHDLEAVKADPSQMEQVILNLCINARDAMPDGGRITIETRNVAREDTDAGPHVHGQSKPYVCLTVTDTGTGMCKEILSHVFEPFYTTKGPDKGTGLGLATVYGIVKQSGGRVEVQSEPGRGSTFSVYLPAEIQRQEHQQLTRPPQEVGRGLEVILLVEDSAALRAVTCEHLKACGYTVLEAENGEHALQIAEGFHGKIDLLLTDVSLPKLRGTAVGKSLTQQRPEIRVLYMSGYADTAIVESGILKPGAAFIQKPFSLKELACKIREALEKSPAKASAASGSN